jgi:tripartite-type tricarboxylate transporter receptor subunit TctC
VFGEPRSGPPFQATAMKLGRGQFLYLVSAAAAVPVASRHASALDYPTRPVRMIVGLGTGGAVDIIARLIAQWLSERLRQPFIVENSPGAGSKIATEAVVRSQADGYTLLLLSP